MILNTDANHGYGGMHFVSSSQLKLGMLCLVSARYTFSSEDENEMCHYSFRSVESSYGIWPGWHFNYQLMQDRRIYTAPENDGRWLGFVKNRRRTRSCCANT
ncbi:hypothetical protein BS78_04G069400 [Paspalum vaginatum]|nr:hypothetical protein BS78_04G069400 [Paspalum vaginatum]KAJ1278297.1 hypothetical protein BS78_04G069400 [Paspalum vaginatum]